jgi:hypothetical protein
MSRRLPPMNVEIDSPNTRRERCPRNLGGAGFAFLSRCPEQRDLHMTDCEISDFVIRFSAAWSERSGAAFLDLWEPDGLLHSPLYDRPIRGDEFGALTELIVKFAPDQVWQLLEWTSRPTRDGAVVVIEWQSTRNVDGLRFDWRGVDKITLRQGKIAEEIVYFDSAPLRARRSGEKLEALVKF